MPEGYLITKPDGTRHAVIKSRAMTEFLQLHNSQCEESERIKYVQMDEAEAEAIIAREGVRDNSHSPVPKVGALQNIVKSQQSEIEQLKAELEAFKESQEKAKQEESESMQLNVAKTLEILNALTTVKEINDFMVGEERATIINAANKLIKKLS